MGVRGLLALAVAAVLPAQAPKALPEGEQARRAFKQVLTAVVDGWFGKAYQDLNAVEIQGSLGITVTPQALNAQINSSSRGQIKSALTKGASVQLKLKGTYFANHDFRTEVAGDFGSLLYTRIGKRGFLYSREQNAYTTRIAPPPTDAPLTFLTWFRQVTQDIQTVYVEGDQFRPSMAKDEQGLPTVRFVAPTSAYDPKKREQSLAESLGFWKRGRLEVSYVETTKRPQRLLFTNEAQGVSTRMAFTYDTAGRLQAVVIDNQSRGVQGPASVRLTYGPEGLIRQVAGNLTSQRQNVTFDLQLAWQKGRKPSSIVSVPPPGAAKKGGDEMKTLLAVGLAGRILDLQRKGLNLRSVTLTNS